MSMNPRLLRPRASGFNPRSISGLFQWFDGSDRATLFDATTGGSAVADNGAVARWEDKSGNARHLTQGTAGNRPTLRPAIRNGRSVLEYDGANSSLVSASSTNDLSSLSIFAVFTQDTLGQNSAAHLWATDTTSGNGQRRLFLESGPVLAASFGSNVGRSPFLSSATSAFTRVHAFWNGGTNRATDFSFLEDGVSRASTSTGTITVDPSPAGAIAVGNRPLASRAWDGYIAEVLVYTRFLSVSERTRVDNWLKAKWGF
jgi:hypothetical protein